MSRAGDRYDALYDALDGLSGPGRTLNYLEIGTHSGFRAAALCRYWIDRTGGHVNYVGFDLFEEADPVRHAHEYLKSTAAPPLAEVSRRLHLPGVVAALVRGDTRVTFPAAVPPGFVPDLVFVDGGHSLETVARDWEGVRAVAGPGTVVVLDDYFENRPDLGCKRLVDGLADPEWLVTPSARVDVVPTSGLVIRTVTARRRG